MAKLSPEEFLDLMEVVESQGGVHLRDACDPRPYTLEMQRADGTSRKRRFFSTGCRQDARFVVPYVGEDDESNTLTACAVDDNMASWPRFQQTIEEFA